MFSKLTDGYGYFLVTLLNELRSQPQTIVILYNSYPLIADQDGYLLSDLNPDP